MPPEAVGAQLPQSRPQPPDRPLGPQLFQYPVGGHQIPHQPAGRGGAAISRWAAPISFFRSSTQPLSYGGRFFVSAWGELRYDLQDIYLDDDRVAEYAIRQPRAGMDLGLSLGKAREIRVGPVWRHIRAFPDVGFSILPSLDETHRASGFSTWPTNWTTPTSPNAGRYSELSYFQGLRALGGEVDYTRPRFPHVEFFKLGKNVIEARIAGGSSFNSSLPPLTSSLWEASFPSRGTKRGSSGGTTLAPCGWVIITAPPTFRPPSGAASTWAGSSTRETLGGRVQMSVHLICATRRPFSWGSTRAWGPSTLLTATPRPGTTPVYLSLGRSF